MPSRRSATRTCWRCSAPATATCSGRSWSPNGLGLGAWLAAAGAARSADRGGGRAGASLHAAFDRRPERAARRLERLRDGNRRRDSAHDARLASGGLGGALSLGLAAAWRPELAPFALGAGRDARASRAHCELSASRCSCSQLPRRCRLSASRCCAGHGTAAPCRSRSTPSPPILRTVCVTRWAALRSPVCLGCSWPSRAIGPACQRERLAAARGARCAWRICARFVRRRLDGAVPPGRAGAALYRARGGAPGRASAASTAIARLLLALAVGAALGDRFGTSPRATWALSALS